MRQTKHNVGRAARAIINPGAISYNVASWFFTVSLIFNEGSGNVGTKPLLPTIKIGTVRFSISPAIA